MRISYLMTVSPPAMAGTDAVVQEAEMLRARFGGEMHFLLPAIPPRGRFPRSLYGLHRIGAIRKKEASFDLHHLYGAELYYFPVLRLLRKPVVYTVASGLGPEKRLPSTEVLRRLDAIVVPSEGELDRLRVRALDNGHVFRPGIDVSRFDDAPPPNGAEFVLLSGSAPWTRKQFRTKGVDVLLRLAHQMPDLRLVFLWRGSWTEEIRRRVRSMRLSDRVEIHTDRVDVNPVLHRAHAAVVLADKPKLVKAYPHSLLEALACGRPVLVSECIGLADYVRKTGCGEVVRSLELPDLLQAIERVRDDYDAYRARARRVGKRDFGADRLVDAYGELYRSLASAPRGGRAT